MTRTITGLFDSRAEAAFSSAGANSHSGPAHNGKNGNTSFGGNNAANAADAAPADPFNFLTSGLSGLSMNDDAKGSARRNGAGAVNKSPA